MSFIRNFFRILMNGVQYRFLCPTISSLNVIYIVICLTIKQNNVIYFTLCQVIAYFGAYANYLLTRFSKQPDVNKRATVATILCTV